MRSPTISHHPPSGPVKCTSVGRYLCTLPATLCPYPRQNGGTQNQRAGVDNCIPKKKKKKKDSCEMISRATVTQWPSHHERKGQSESLQLRGVLAAIHGFNKWYKCK